MSHGRSMGAVLLWLLLRETDTGRPTYSDRMFTDPIQTTAHIFSLVVLNLAAGKP